MPTTSIPVADNFTLVESLLVEATGPVDLSETFTFSESFTVTPSNPNDIPIPDPLLCSDALTVQTYTGGVWQYPYSPLFTAPLRHSTTYAPHAGYGAIAPLRRPGQVNDV